MEIIQEKLVVDSGDHWRSALIGGNHCVDYNSVHNFPTKQA